MGTALGVCFGYWLGTAGLLFLASYASDTRLSVPSMLCLIVRAPPPPPPPAAGLQPGRSDPRSG